jgi:hypothetical protein
MWLVAFGKKWMLSWLLWADSGVASRQVSDIEKRRGEDGMGGDLQRNVTRQEKKREQKVGLATVHAPPVRIRYES